MQEKTYKVRVQMELIVEFAVGAVHEDGAAAVAEEIVWDESQSFTTKMRKHYRIPNVGVRCVEVEECSEPN